jgi:anti-sigma regulatory factor (Ser/Thr protein kinase)
VGTLAQTKVTGQGRRLLGLLLCRSTLPGVRSRVGGPSQIGPDVSKQRLTLADGLQAPAHARAWTSERLPPLPGHITEDALLLVSELVTNAVRHGRPDIEISLVIAADRVRIEVRDGGDALPILPSGQPSIDRPTGRGLLIVAATASDWGIERTPGTAGKTVWAELDATRSAGF